MAVIQVPPDSTGKRVDTVTLTDALVEVHRQKMVVTGGSGTAEVVVVTDAAPAGTEMGLVVRQAGTIQAAIATPFTIQAISTTVTVAGIVALSAGAANIGFINHISRTVTVVGVVSFAAGTILDSISATVGVKGQVSLAAGTSNIGTINDISRTVQVAIGTPFILDSISATVGVKGQVSLAAGTSNIGFINNISATVTVAGNVSASIVGNVNISNTPSVVLAAGTAVFGTLNDISRTVQVAIATPYILQGISTTVTTVVSGYTPATMSASRGPKCVTASTSSNVTLIASPGAGANIYVTRLMVGNFSATLTKARVGTSASIATIVQPLAASGGGFVLDFDPPWMLSASEACLCSIKPNAADAFFTVMFFVK